MLVRRHTLTEVKVPQKIGENGDKVQEQHLLRALKDPAGGAILGTFFDHFNAHLRPLQGDTRGGGR